MKKLMLVLLFGLFIFMTGCASYDSMDIEKGVNDQYILSDPLLNEENNEEYGSIVENPFISTSDMSVSTFSSDVDTASYSNVRRMLNDNQLPYVDAVRIEEMINYFDYDLNEPGEDEVIGITTELSTAPWNNEHQLLMIGLKTEAIEFENTAGNNLVFLLDVSGSMGSADKLPLLQSAIKLLVNELRPQDRISIVVYAGAAGVIIDGADGGSKQEIIDAVDGLQSGGSTAGGEGINLAYDIALNNYIEGGNNRVILGTDGDFNVGVTTNGGLEDLIVEKRETGIYLSVLGFGTGNLQDEKMETLADKGNGVYYYIDSILEAKKVFVSELGASLITVAKDVKLQIEFNPANVKGYRLIGYENRMLDYNDFVDDEKDAGDMGAGHSVIAFYEIILASSTEEIDELEFETPDELKYTGDNYTDEIMTLSIRYKEPNYESSVLIEEVVNVNEFTETPSDVFNFASSVAEFGLLLRDSDYKFNSSYEVVLTRATASKGLDEFGYRTEFLLLVETAKLLSD